jgi:LPS O-antigen subunit length determinant protein (WzzB/FepE family)
MSDSPRFDLIDIVQAIQQRLKFILLVMLFAAIAAAAFNLLTPRKYKATTELLVTNPLYTDRNNLYRNDKATFVDYYGREDDVDKVMAVAKAKATHDSIIKIANLWARYGMDTVQNKKWLKDAEDRFDKAFDTKRTEYITVELSYTERDPLLAADICNLCAQIINRVYSGYYNELRLGNRRTIERQLKYADSMVTILTDSLASMRDRYGIYDIMSPARISLGAGGHSGVRNGRAMEEIQNMEATKDQLVMDRMRYQSLISEYSTAVNTGDQPQIQIFSPASVPTDPKGLNLPLTIIVGAVLGAFFAILWVLFTTYYRRLNRVQR